MDENIAKEEKKTSPPLRNLFSAIGDNPFGASRKPITDANHVWERHTKPPPLRLYKQMEREYIASVKPLQMETQLQREDN
jgi:hypothetical protein